jgi:hypothetical protein
LSVNVHESTTTGFHLQFAAMQHPLPGDEFPLNVQPLMTLSPYAF